MDFNVIFMFIEYSFSSFFSFYLNVSLPTLFLLMAVVILLLTPMLLRTTRYFLIKKIRKLENAKNH